MKISKNKLIGLSLCTCLAINAIADTNDLEEVTVVSASGFEQNIAEAPASITVVTGEELQKKAYTNVLDAMKNIPGVLVSGGGGSELEIKLRGMDKEYTLYLVDGKPISTARNIHADSTKTNGKIGLALPNIDMIERIEIIRGPMSSLYGSEAMGGVINIITKKVSDKWGGSFSTEYTKSKNSLSNDSKNASLYLSGPILKDKLSLSLSGFTQDTDESDVSDEHGEKASTKKKFGSGLNLKLNDQNTLGLNYEYSKQEYETTNESDSDDNLDYGQEKTLYSLDHEANYDNFIVNSYVQNDNTKAVNGDDQEEDILTFNTKASYFLEDNIITFGGQYKKEEFKDEVNNDLGGAIDRWLGALFVENEWSTTDDFALTLGARYNDDEIFGSEVTPRIYGVYNLNSNLTLKAGVSAGYKQPDITQTVEDYGTTVSSRGSVIGVESGNTDLKPEESTNYEIGANLSLPENSFNSSFTIYKTDFENKLAQEYTCGTKRNRSGGCYYNGVEYNFLRQMVNLDKAEIKGAELTFDFKLAPTLNVSANYTFTESEQKSGDYKGEALNKIPKRMANINLDMQATKSVNIWLQHNYRGKTEEFTISSGADSSSTTEATPSYSFDDIGIVYLATNDLTLKAGIYNFMDKTIDYDTYGVVLDGRRVNVGLNYRF